jgi:hypothetical protein
VDVVVFAVAFRENAAEVVADLLETVPQNFMGAVAEDPTSVFRGKHQVNMKGTYNAATPSIYTIHACVSFKDQISYIT